MKLENMIIEDPEGNEVTIDRKSYIAGLVADAGVKAYKTERSTTEPDKLVDYILKTKEKGQEVDEGVSENYTDLINRIDEDIARTEGAKENKKAEAEKKAQEKEDAKKQKEETKLRLAADQQLFAEKAMEGAESAEKEYQGVLTRIMESLPKGAKIINKGHGFGLSFDEGVTKETIGSTFGYLLQTADNSSFIGNQLHFWVGDVISISVERGIYTSASEAAIHIAGVISDKTKKQIQPASLDQYKRMAERTPVELRNPRVDPTAYLLVSSMKSPKKEEKETDDSFKDRVSKFEEDRRNLQEKLSSGEVTKRKEALPLVHEVLINNGLRAKPEEGADKKPTVGEYFQIYFYSCFALTELLGVHEEGVIIYKKGEQKITVTQEEMEARRDEAYANLSNVLYSTKSGITAKDYSRGYTVIEVKKEAYKDADGKAVMEPVKTKNPVYPIPFFEIDESEPEVSEEASTEDKPEADDEKATADVEDKKPSKKKAK